MATTVGFYYMSNAGGRLVGTVLSGVLYTYGPGALPARFGACLVGAAVFAAASAAVAGCIPDPDAGLACGPCLSFAGRKGGGEAAPAGLAVVEGGDEAAPGGPKAGAAGAA